MSPSENVGPSGQILALGLTELFDLQDEALRRNLLNAEGVHQFSALLSSLVGVCYEALHEMRFPATKQTVVRHLATDALSHLVVATRVGLWGAFPESLSVLRGAIESCAQFTFVVLEKKYATVMYEAKELKRFRQVDFDSACEQLGDLGNKLRKLHNQISEAAGHSTVKRFSLLEYEFEDQEYDRLGFAVDPTAARLLVFHGLQLASVLAASLRLAYFQDRLEFRWNNEIDHVRDFIEAMPTASSEADKNK